MLHRGKSTVRSLRLAAAILLAAGVFPAHAEESEQALVLSVRVQVPKVFKTDLLCTNQVGITSGFVGRILTLENGDRLTAFIAAAPDVAGTGLRIEDSRADAQPVHSVPFDGGFDDLSDEAYDFPGTLFVAVAVWGPNVSCVFHMNDIVIPMTKHSGQFAHYLTADNDSSGVSVRHSSVSGEAMLTFQETSSGTLFAFAIAEQGYLSLRDPSGVERTSSGFGPELRVAQATNGMWTFSAPWAAGVGGDLNLWMVTIPDV
jgi:hypothetical protein